MSKRQLLDLLKSSGAPNWRIGLGSWMEESLRVQNAVDAVTRR